MGLKIRSILLYLPWALPIVLLSWFFIQQAIGESKFKKTSFLFEISEQNKYLVKRVATGVEADLGIFPLENDDTSSSVYLDPDGKSVWFYFNQNGTEKNKIKNKTPFYWVQYDFEGEVLDSLTQGDFPPSGGKTLVNKMGEYLDSMHDVKSPMYATYFQFQSVNWFELNPFRYCSPEERSQKRGPWKGMLQLQLNMPEGQVEFKVATSKANDIYTFTSHLYEIPSKLTSNQLSIFYLKDTEHPELDKGLYFIYKKG